LALLLGLFASAPQGRAAQARSQASNNPALNAYFEAETARLSQQCLAEIRTLNDWQTSRAEYRRKAAEMLGLWPDPPRTDLKAVVTGSVLMDDFKVEKLHFQSMPGLYVTANLYLPKTPSGPAPTILYLCGHGPVVSNNVSYGNKVSYQHHGIWFARNGYVCLLIDTLQYGEILGHHAGTYREKAWWWNARGYTPAGVEAWNAIRALDYLGTRPEVDTNRFGVTGRSGGGSYTWTLAALDDRPRVLAPVAGITDLRNHVVDGAVEGHCDCMFVVNTYRLDYPALAALAAPRPLLLVNTDSDDIFPLDGVMRTYAHLKRLYGLHNQATNLGLVIGPGPHKDTQNLQMPVFRWFNQHLKGQDPVIDMAAVKLLTPKQLKVFETLPADQINTRVEEVFVPRATPPSSGLSPNSDSLMRELRRQSFAGWPAEMAPARLRVLSTVRGDEIIHEDFEVETQPHVVLRGFLARRASASRELPILVSVESGSPLAPPADLSELPEHLGGMASFMPRLLGPVWAAQDERKLTQLRRRFQMLGQTADGMRVWDIRRVLQALRADKEFGKHPLRVRAAGDMAVNTLYASLFEPAGVELELSNLPASHMTGPDYLNVLKIMDVPQALEMARGRGRVTVVH
jgi:dienelactone hydrolase